VCDLCAPPGTLHGMGYAFQATAVAKRFKTTTALAGVDLAAPPGTVHAVLGPNGAGKTTLVRILATLLRPDAGTATVGGFDVVRDAARVRRLIGLAGQYASVDEDLTGMENLVLIGELLDLPRRAARTRASELLEEFERVAAAGRRVSGYSGGMRRRLDLATGVVGRPRVIYLDEPTTGLDPAPTGPGPHPAAPGATAIPTTEPRARDHLHPLPVRRRHPQRTQDPHPHDPTLPAPAETPVRSGSLGGSRLT
jgi:ABC-type branched-subunit amino acid transport system ATPase component